MSLAELAPADRQRIAVQGADALWRERRIEKVLAGIGQLARAGHLDRETQSRIIGAVRARAVS